MRVVTGAEGFKNETCEAFAKGFEAGLTDGFPYLVISQSSVDAVNKKLGDKPASTVNYRPNIVVSGCEPWAEDQWSMYKIGSVLFQNCKPCCRCRVTAVDPGSGEDNKFDTLTVLNKYRKGRDIGVGEWGAGQFFFGQNAVAHNPGIIHEGDAVEVLAFENWDKIVGAQTHLKKSDLTPSQI